MQELVQKVITWAEQRNIITEVEVKDQIAKVFEEVQETFQAIKKHDILPHNDLQEEIYDGIGDTVVTLIILDRIIQEKLGGQDLPGIDWEKDYRSRIIRLLTVAPLNNINNLFLEHAEWLTQVSEDKQVIREMVLDLYGFCQLLAKKREKTAKSCLEHAYEEIKDREGEVNYMCDCCNEYGIKEISEEEAEEIIDNREPEGLFFIDKENKFIAIDNETGDAWTEEFEYFTNAIDYLLGEDPVELREKESLLNKLRKD